MDRRTLFSMQAGLLLFLGGVILLAFHRQRGQKRDKGSVWFAAAYLCSGLGLALQSERDVIPPFFAIVLGNFFFLLFGVLANYAVCATTRQRSRTWTYLLALNFATVANFTYYTYWQPNLFLRVMEAGAVIVLMHLALIVALLRVRERVIQPAMRSMALLLGLHSFFALARMSMVVQRRNADVLLSWIGVITIAGLALCYLWMDSLRVHAELEQSAMTDPLTGLYNRRILEVTAIHEIQRAARRGLPCSAIMLDVDRFKVINDELGHAAGDSSLSAVAGALQASLRASDIATRLGGDEFFVLLPGADEASAGLVVARIRAAIAALRLQTMGGESFSVSVSVGQVTQRGTKMTVEDLLHASDIMLYREKQLSRSRGFGSGTRQAGGAQVHPSNA
ncbi:GGDEF domain-containing protein [Terriglobus roseus]|uniref:diguanylate cyclase n=1 Tax=Terriglobus roseus TaxID=392734 RepID=A0A1H4LEB3_9BACT|nr:diguanylate cyclase [Terriglobus roseus]SEB69067.1 diguanylate cyclase (GGDEF) domain-containing protein [Terriglobus roseus]